MNLNELMPQLEELKAEVLKLIEKNNNQQAEIDFLKKEILEKHEDWKHEGQQAANARAEIKALKEPREIIIKGDLYLANVLPNGGMEVRLKKAMI